jgi:hypothetical protein
MKQKQLSIAILLCIFCLQTFQSCTKNGEIANEQDLAKSNLSYATQRAILAPNLITLKQSVSLLSDEERQKLWELRLNQILKNDAGKLTKEQNTIILSIRDFLATKTIKELVKNPKEGEVFIKSQLEYFQKHFDNAQLFMLIECPYYSDDISIFKSMEYLTKIDHNILSRTADETDLTFDDETSVEPKCTCYYSIYCSIGGGGGGTCNTGGCQKNANCGLAGTSNCKGRCG